MYASILAAGVLGYLLNVLFLLLDKRVVHWSGRA
jgi:NitT/TauT family transport system permease protein